MKIYAQILTVLTALFAVSCSNFDMPIPDRGHSDEGKRVEYGNPRYRQVMIYYGEAYNNLAADISKNLEELENGYVPSKNDHEAILCYVHKSRNRSDWATLVEPVLFRMYRHEGRIVRDTLIRYPSDVITVNPDMVRKVFSDIRQKFPSQSYGMVFSSHSSGWVPADYKIGSEDDTWSYSVSQHSIGAQYDSKRQEHTMDVKDFANAIPFKLNYIIFDCCLMGGIETTYMLKDKANFVIASPTEVLSEGFNYKTLVSRLLEEDKPDLAGVCEDYYKKQLGGYGATVGLYDCSKIEAVANLCADIFSTGGDVLKVDPNTVQDYNYSFEFHYDFRDIIAKMGTSNAYLEKLDEILDEFVVCKYATKNFISTPISPDTFSGISMYLPKTHLPVLNSRYKETDWNLRTGLLK